jgi:hypothetical protein
MERRGWWHDAGEAVGNFLGWVLRGLLSLWEGLGGAVRGFFEGLAQGIGLAGTGIVVWVTLGIGIFLIVLALRGFLRRSILGPLILLAIGLFLISTVMV